MGLKLSDTATAATTSHYEVILIESKKSKSFNNYM